MALTYQMVMLIGFFLILFACTIWGLVFVIPTIIVDQGFMPHEVALVRYFFLGILSVSIMVVNYRHYFRKIPISLWLKACLFGLIANVIYYALLVMGLVYSSAQIGTLIIGICPVTIAIYGNFKTHEVTYESLILPSIAILAGLVLVNWRAIHADFDEDTTPVLYLMGLCCSFIALGIWTWYAVNNSLIMKRTTLEPSVWSTLVGACTFIWVILFSTILTVYNPDPAFLSRFTTWSNELLIFLGGGLVLGFVCSWLGSYLWNKAASRLPVAIAGQLTVFETVFGLLFIFLADLRIPQITDLVGIVILLLGVLYSLSVFHPTTNVPLVE